jgi:hypothetical protein
MEASKHTSGTDGSWDTGIAGTSGTGGFQLLSSISVSHSIILVGAYTMRLYDNAAYDYYYFSD